jgi:tripartite-type tricarboxylate transporter receptor subunit TctC
LRLAAGVAALPVVLRTARAQTYPTRPARIIVGFPPGGPTDLLARLIGQWLTERLGQQFIIENRPGGGTNIAAEAAAKAPPDGYTLLLVGPSYTINATLYEKLNYNFVRDIAPVAGLTRSALVMVVNPTVPARTVPEFIAVAKASPGKLNLASGGTGTGAHLAGELFRMMAGLDLLHVPYRGDVPALTDLIGGRVQVFFSTLPGAIEHIKDGKLRALAVTTETRSEFLPDIPVVSDFLPGYEVSLWNGLGAPKDTPAEIIDKLHKEIDAAFSDEIIKARISTMAKQPDADDARKLWAAYRQGNREVGEGDPRSKHQTGVIRQFPRDMRYLGQCRLWVMNARLYKRLKSNSFRNAPKADIRERTPPCPRCARSGHRQFMNSRRGAIAASEDPALLTEHDELAGILHRGQVEHRPGHGGIADPGDHLLDVVLIPQDLAFAWGIEVLS